MKQQAIEAAKRALREGAPRDLAHHDYTEEATVCYEAIAPIVRAQERAAVVAHARRWTHYDFAEAIRNGAHERAGE